MNERVELRLFSDDEVKIVAYEWDGLKLVMVETTYDKTWVSSQLSDDPPDDGWWEDDGKCLDWIAKHEYDNTWDDIVIPLDDYDLENGYDEAMEAWHRWNTYDEEEI